MLIILNKFCCYRIQLIFIRVYFVTDKTFKTFNIKMCSLIEFIIFLYKCQYNFYKTNNTNLCLRSNIDWFYNKEEYNLCM